MLSALLPTARSVRERVERIELPWSQHGIDPFGIDQNQLGKFYTALGFFYRKYFKVEVYGIENVPAHGRAMLIGNHSGGVAIDGAMVVASTFFELEPPRLAQGMADRFLNKLPGASQITSRLGHFTGLPEHAKRLLNDDRLLMVFPEGARGTAKLAKDADSLVGFGSGFMRLALETKSPIVPVAFVGGGDAFPTVMNLTSLGKVIGVPYIPVTKYLVPVPTPTTLQLLYSEPMYFEGDGNETDATIREYVEQVRDRLRWLIQQGRDLREGRLRPEELELR